MRKFTFIEIFIVAMIIVCGVALLTMEAYAEKTITFSKMNNYGGRIFFNVPKEVIIEGNTTTEYYPFGIQLWGKSKGTGGVVSSASKTQLFGIPSNTTYAPRELYQVAPNFIKSLMKELWLDILNDDLEK